MNQENHEIKSFGPQFFIETGSDKMEKTGKAVYKIAAITKNGKFRNNITFHEPGLARYYTEGRFQVETGYHGKPNDVNYLTTVHQGDYSVNADKGAIRIKGKNIILEAEDNLTLKAGTTIQIGEKDGSTDLIKLQARKIIADTKGGNIGDILKSSSLFKSFAGSFVAGGPLGSAAAGMIAKKFF